MSQSSRELALSGQQKARPSDVQSAIDITNINKYKAYFE